MDHCPAARRPGAPVAAFSSIEEENPALTPSPAVRRVHRRHRSRQTPPTTHALGAAPSADHAPHHCRVPAAAPDPRARTGRRGTALRLHRWRPTRSAGPLHPLQPARPLPRTFRKCLG
ncbi:hypothetical protein GCM10027440_30440 [Nocardiopsis coralliicola]